ncbi:hypothetical protein DSM106972_051450 [Dulcicalothrix desertica PCC 7102]|uniref:Uncharacterized protein n=1 Tax=Dulcicalothrix desertica PCC 7102 TaxID=232991 RepID=A0A433VBM7_9CYAN|nr:hypothetical protein [Dulcicalothrix desertica]RUT03506.1 hypothetical protein DSM106972_051450 [Dulcicalothrix desertica PCC 7102]TWH50572.1 hypothetical protein CAL7102_04894 [Dulcicalothrix desertica PCC 7102]
MSRLLYESSVSYKGYLIIPFVFNQVDGNDIYSYKLLAEIGYRSRYHKADNPAKSYGASIGNVVDIAKGHLDKYSDFTSREDVFKHRYTFRHNLIIIFNEANKYFYDHYPPETLNNIAAPKVFTSEIDCISWIKQGMDGLHVRRQVR